MTCEEFRENADALALGALPPEEASTARLHMASCEECAARYRAAARVAERLPLAAPLVRAPAELRTAVLSAIRGAPGSASPSAANLSAMPRGTADRSVSTDLAANSRPAGMARPGRPGGGSSRLLALAGRRVSLPALAAAAVFVALIGLAAWTVWLQTQVHDLRRSQALAASRAPAPVGATATPSTLARAEADALVLLSSPTTVRAHLWAPASASAATGAIYWSPDQRRCVILVRQLAPLGPGQEYHVWFRAGDQRWDGGPLAPDNSGVAEAVVSMDRWQIASGYTVNVVVQPSPDGSAPQPVLTANVQASTQ